MQFQAYGPNGPEMFEFDAMTADGVPITPGLRVWTNNLDRGVVVLPAEGRYRPDLEIHPDAAPEHRRVWWFYVQIDGEPGINVMQDGSRVATRFEGRPA